jgi:hypothetical protein
MNNGYLSLKWVILIVISVTLLITSCKTTSEIPRSVARPISTLKLLDNIENNAFKYDYFTIKRINCQFSGNETKANFRISLKAIKDKQILVAISKLNIPVGRVLLTPDSVKYVNYIDRNYFVDDYSYLSNFLNIDLDFATIQSIIANNAFSYRNDSKNRDFKTFDSSIENGMYVLQSEKERKIVRIEEKSNSAKIDRRLKRLDDEALILQKMYFDPGNFALTKLFITDKTHNRVMEMTFQDFVKVERKDYPGSIDMSFTAPNDNVSMKIKMSGFSTEKIDPLSIEIPDKYVQISVR